MSNCYLIIAATGVGTRMNSEVPKQYLKLNNDLTLLEQSLETLLKIKKIKAIVIAINENDIFFTYSKFYNHPKITTVIGGEKRFNSVFNALNKLNDIAKNDDWILVHDSVRPCVKVADVEKLITQLKDENVGGLLAIPIVDTLKKINSNNTVTTVNREKLYAAQTPQMYRFKLIKKALKNVIDKKQNITDETQAIEMLNLVPKIVIGSKENIKITYKEDLDLANFYLEKNEN